LMSLVLIWLACTLIASRTTARTNITNSFSNYS